MNAETKIRRATRQLKKDLERAQQAAQAGQLIQASLVFLAAHTSLLDAAHEAIDIISPQRADELIAEELTSVDETTIEVANRLP